MQMKDISLKMPISLHKRLVAEKARRIPQVSVNSLIVEAVVEKYGKIPAPRVAS